MTREQLLVLAGMAGAGVVTALLFLIPAGHDGRDALHLACATLAAPAICITAGVGYIANRRFFDREAIRGEATTPSIERAQRYLGNTVEQATLAATSWFAFSATLPDRAAAMLPALAATFVAARVLFALGYVIAPKSGISSG